VAFDNDNGQQTALLEPNEPAENVIVHSTAVISLLRQADCNDIQLLASLIYDLSRRTWQFGGAAAAAAGHHIISVHYRQQMWDVSS